MYLPRGPENIKPADTCTQMFRAALFIIATGENNPNVHQLTNVRCNEVYPYNGMLFGYKKE